MRINKITIVGYLFGAFIIVASTLRWYIQPEVPTYSKLAFAIAIGCFVILFSEYFNWRRKVNEQLSEHYQRLETVGAFVTGNALEAVKEEIYTNGNK